MHESTAENAQLVSWSPRQAAAMGKEIFVGKHRLHERQAFSDEALIGLLARHPRERLQVFSSGTDPRRFKEDWHLVEADRASPHEIMAALAKGRLWVNLQRIDQSTTLGPLVNGLYESLQQICAGLQPFSIQASLFISSPGAIVYYHADASPNLLWHLRGTKRIWVYPAQDKRLVPQPLMEDIFAGTVDEVPYSGDFDRHSQVLELHPGDVASWPQNSPHRVETLDNLNVSITSMHWTADSERRKLIYLSNRYFRRQLKLPIHSTVERGAMADIKCFAYRVCNRLGLVPLQMPPSEATYSDRGHEKARFRLDGAAPGGIRPM
jgi:hypothetical protein